MAEERKTLEQRAQMTDIERLRHSAAHVLATAILRIWPEAQFAAGPPVENGFYYDVELPHRISPEDFPRIEEEMKKEKIENAEKKKNDKKKKRDNLDEDGNEKPKKPLNKYQQFIRDNQERIKEEFPELSNTERFTKLAEEWGKFKATLEDPTEPAEPVNTVVEEEDKEEEEEDQ